VTAVLVAVRRSGGSAGAPEVKLPRSHGVHLLVPNPLEPMSYIDNLRLSGDGTTAVFVDPFDLVPGLPNDRLRRIYAVDVATGEPSLVTEAKSVPLAISYDGRSILVELYEKRENVGLAVMDTKSGESSPLLPGEIRDVAGADFSADGSTLAIVIEHDIYVVDVATGNVRQPLPDADGSFADPHLSSDGRLLAVTSAADNLPVGAGAPGHDAIVVDLSTNEVTFAYDTSDPTFADHSTSAAGMSADGSILAINVQLSNVIGAPASTSVGVPFLYDRAAATTSAVELPTDDGMPILANALAISADGQRVLIGGQLSSTTFMYDVAAGTATDIFPTVDGAPPHSFAAAFSNELMSADGDVVVVTSISDRLSIDPNQLPDVVVWSD